MRLLARAYSRYPLWYSSFPYSHIHPESCCTSVAFSLLALSSHRVFLMSVPDAALNPRCLVNEKEEEEGWGRRRGREGREWGRTCRAQ